MGKSTTILDFFKKKKIQRNSKVNIDDESLITSSVHIAIMKILKSNFEKSKLMILILVCWYIVNIEFDFINNFFFFWPHLTKFKSQFHHL